MEICGDNTGGPGDIKEGVDTVTLVVTAVPLLVCTLVVGTVGALLVCTEGTFTAVLVCTGTADTLYCIVVPKNRVL